MGPRPGGPNIGRGIAVKSVVANFVADEGVDGGIAQLEHGEGIVVGARIPHQVVVEFEPAIFGVDHVTVLRGLVLEEAVVGDP